MMTRKGIQIHNRRYKGKGVVELLEEATALVRRASAKDLCCYYLGSLPFVFELLSFCSGMGAYAGTAARLISHSLLLALLYVWMKCWQAVYAGRLLARLRNAPPATISPLRLAIVQGSLQPWCFPVMPVALLLTLPFGWCYAFFQNLTVLGCEGDTGTVLRNARRQAGLFQAQNLLAVTIFVLLYLLLFVNLLAVSFFIPFMLKTLLGLETPFTRSFHFFLNPALLASLAAITHLLVDPLVKASYVLRCFYGDSIASGADLLTELRSAQRKKIGRAALLLAGGALVTALAWSPSSAANGRVSAEQVGTAGAAELDRAIGEVLERPEFSWPSAGVSKLVEKPEVPGFFSSLLDTLKEWLRKLGNWLGKLIRWLVEHFMGDSSEKGPDRTGNGHRWAVPLTMYLLTAAILSWCGVVMYRRLKSRKRVAAPSPLQEEVTVPDLMDDAVTAEALSMDRWLGLADELMERGETRLALRALYFACIVRLSEAGFLTMDRTKSDRDYQLELRRRAHSIPSLREAFSENVALFQRSWYGSHEASGEDVDRFMANYRRMAANEV